MTIVDWKTFAELPAGTVFAFCFQDRVTPMTHLCVKGKTEYDAGYGPDFEAGPLVPVDFEYFFAGPCVVDGEHRMRGKSIMYGEAYKKRVGCLRTRRFAIPTPDEIRSYIGHLEDNVNPSGGLTPAPPYIQG